MLHGSLFQSFQVCVDGDEIERHAPVQVFSSGLL